MKAKTISYARKTAYFLENGRLRKGRVLRRLPYKAHPTDPSKNRIESLVIETTGKTPAKKTFPISEVVVEITGTDIPKVWQDTLKRIPSRQRSLVGVCFVPHTYPICTTLFHKRTLKKLRYQFEEVQTGGVELWEGSKIPSEGKPELEISETSYHVDGIEVEMDVDYSA